MIVVLIAVQSLRDANDTQIGNTAWRHRHGALGD